MWLSAADGGGAMWLSAADGMGQCGSVQPMGWGNVA